MYVSNTKLYKIDRSMSLSLLYPYLFLKQAMISWSVNRNPNQNLDKSIRSSNETQTINTSCGHVTICTWERVKKITILCRSRWNLFSSCSNTCILYYLRNFTMLKKIGAVHLIKSYGDEGRKYPEVPRVKYLVPRVKYLVLPKCGIKFQK